MKIFNRIRNYFENTRIDLDFPNYESQCLREHEQQSLRIFSTEQLDAERLKLLAQIESQTSKKYDNLINAKIAKRASHRVEAKEAEFIYSYFARNYRQEIDNFNVEKKNLFMKKDAIFKKRSEIEDSLSDEFNKKNKAYSDLNFHKERINSWYAKSDRTPWLFGNAKKKLPKHSLFGQSFGDLDAHKASRDSANDDIERVKRRIGILKQDKNLLSTDIDKVNKRISEISNEIRSTIEDRSKLHDFEKFGHNRQDLQFKLHSLLGKTGKLDFEICGLNSDRDEYFTQEKHRYGVVDLEIKIAKVQQMKMQFLDSFKNEDNKEKRKRLHREAWLKQRARA